jgi:hypothetical protein
MTTLSRIYLARFLAILTLIALFIAGTRTHAQSPPAVDCNCVLKLPALRTNACQAFVPDLCLLATNCFSTNVTIGSPGYCGQTPAPGTPVGPGTTYITFTVVDNLGTASQCVVPFVVTPAQGCLFTLICASNKTVQCGSTWNFNPPTWTNACSPPPGTPSNGVVITIIGTVTNGTCPQIITRTWQGVDDCGYHDQCSQSVTIVDTIPPVLNCTCVTNSSAYPVIMTVQACSGTIPNLCIPAMTCASDACGVVGCSQSPPPGTTVGVGVFPITVTVYDCASNAASCVVNYTVIQPPGGCAFTLLCSSNKTVECGSAWTFNPPTWTNNCSPPPGTPSNGVVVTVISTVTNGTCPMVITRTWQGVDDCRNTNQCSQTVTVVDTTPPLLDCNCLRNPAAIQLSVVACSGIIPNLCLLASSCSSDNCGPLQCWQSPAAGTPVGPGSYPITVMVTDCASNSAFCVLSYTVTPPPGGCNTNPCPFTLAAVLNTGTTNGNGGLLPTGAPEQIWNNIAAPSGPTPMVVANPTIWPIVSGPWVAAGGISAWVTPNANYNDGPPGWYTNRVIYNAPCTNVCLRGRIASDDDGYFYVNGVLVSQSGFTAWSNVNDCVDFVAGPNVIDYVVHNAGGPTGFRTELEFWTQCCTNTNCVVTINCPGSTNITTCNPAGAVVTYPLPQASSTCGVITNIVCTPPSGSAFPIGTTTVTCTAYDSLGNSATCTFTVTVAQAPPPYVICPPLNLSVTGCPPVMPDLTAMVGIITNCPTNCAFTITQTIAAGTILSPGTYVVIVRTCDCQNHCRDCDVIIHAVLSPKCCNLVALPRLFSGATNGPAGLLPGGALDTQFQTGPPLFTTPNPYVPAIIHWLWVPNSPLSKWVGPTPTYANSPLGVFLYTNRFFLCSTNQASLTGRWTADDTGAIWLNGNITTAILPPSWAFTNWHPVNITSGFVPGWNELVFRMTNGIQSVTGLRTEIFGTNCCNSCVNIACPNDIVTNTCAAGVAVNYNFPFASSACANLASVVCTPPPGSFFPVGTTVVTCTAIDTLGNAATCTFKVVVQRIGKPVVLKCPPNQTIYTCGSNAVAYYAPFVSGNVGPVICTPPSGSTFPLGTNIVTCTATNACGAGQSCYFLVIVKPYPLGPPLIFTAGLPDNYVLPVEPSPQTACMVTAFSGYPIWKGFDATGINDLLGHHFTGLPNNIVQAQLIIRMKPGPDDGSDNDGLFIGLPSCSFSSFIFGASIKALPGAVPPTGGTWKTPPNGSTTFTLNLNPALISYMNSAQVLDVVIHDDTTVDYMQLRLWTCPPPFINNGVPHWTTAIAGPPSTIASIAQPELDVFGPIGNGPAVSVGPPSGDVSQPSSVEVGLGGGQGFTFTTILDMNAPAGSQIIISTPTAGGSNAPVLMLAKSCQPKCGWDIIKMKRTDTGTASSRVSAVNSDGSLLDSFIEAEDLGLNEPPLSLHPEDGVTQFPVSLLLEPTTGTITLTFPGSMARRLCNGLPCPRGWDGTIKGRVAGGGRKGWDGTIRCPCFDEEASRVVFTPIGTYTPAPFASLEVRSLGLGELVLAGEQLITMGGHIVRPDLSSPDSLSTFQGTDAGDGVSWSSMADGSGISVDLGRSQSFDLGIHHFENGDIPTEEQLFRIHTNRPTSTGPTYPPPPPIELRLAQGPTGVDCSVDFTTLGAVSVTANLYSNGVFVAYGSIDGPLITPDDPLTFDHWPERVGALPGSGVLRVTSSDFFNIQGFMCDEVQFVPRLPSGSPPVPYYGELQALGSAGLDSMLYGLQRVPACAPATLTITPTSSGTILTWSGIGYRVLGAETLDGPWIDLGLASPAVLPPNSLQRYFRLVCD